MSQPKYAIAITADDKTAKGAAAAEKRLGKIPKHISAVNKAQTKALQDTVGRNSRGIIRTFGDVERASARVFGNRSVTSGFATRLGALREAGSAAGTGLGEAAASGDALTGVLGGLGVVAGATVGVLAAAGYAAFKLADGWAKGAASIGRTSELIGVASKQMQEFAAAAERVGVDKGAAVGTLGTMSDAINGAAYGTNGQALGVLNKLGVKIVRKSDGSVDLPAMLPAIADAIARQNPYGQRVAGNALGISDTALAAFRQGGKALAADMADAEKTAYIATPGDIERGKRIQRKGTEVGQLADRLTAMAGSAAADAAEPGYDAVLSGGRQVMGGATTFGGVVKNIFAPGASAVERGGRSIERAANLFAAGPRPASRLRNGRMNLSPQDIVDLKKTVATEWVTSAGTAQGEGVVDTILNRLASGKWGNTVADVVNARKQFSDINGPVAWKKGRRSVDDLPNSIVKPIVSRMVDNWLMKRSTGTSSIIGDNLNYANPNYSDARNRGWINRLDGPTFGKGGSIHRYGTVPELQRDRPGDFQIGLPGGAIPVKVEVHMRGAPPGTTTKVTAGSGRQPATSYALQPVRGG